MLVGLADVSHAASLGNESQLVFAECGCSESKVL